MDTPTGFGTVTLVNGDMNSASRASSAIMRFYDRKGVRMLSGFVAVLDGQPMGPLNMGGPTSFPVLAGEHVLQGRFAGAARFLNVSPFRSRLFPPYDFTVGSGDHIELEFSSPTGKYLIFRAPGSVPERRLLRRFKRSTTVGATLSEPSLPTAHARQGPASPGSQPGRIRLTGEYRTELRRVDPIPYIAPGTTVTWHSEQSHAERTSETEHPIRAQADANLGPIRVSLSKQFGVEPSRVQTEEQERRLSLPLSGDVASSWDVHVYDVWLYAEYVIAGQQPIPFEFLSMPTASAYPTS